MNLSNDESLVDKSHFKSQRLRSGCFFYCVLCFVLQSFAASMVNLDMLNRLQKNYGDAAYQRGLALKKLLDDLRIEGEQQQLIVVNQFFNQFKYSEDIQQWKQKDYWATPEEFIGVNTGDCEDYVIAKYFALRALGIAEEKLYLTYVKSTRLNVAHMVLSYFATPKSIPLILDNYDLRILPADQRDDLLPVYSFNAQSLFLTNASAGLGKKLPTEKVKNSKWTELLKNLQEIKE